MTRTRIPGVILFSVGILVSAGIARGHHSYAATYLQDRTVSIQGELMVFMYRNPHSILQVLVKAEDGTTHRWACEWAGTLKLGTYGVNSLTLKPGDKVIITGLPGRNQEDHRLLVRTIRRPADGWTWSGESK